MPVIHVLKHMLFTDKIQYLNHIIKTCTYAQFMYLSLTKELYLIHLGSPGGSVVKNPPAKAGDVGLIPGSGNSLEKEWQPIPVFLPGKSHGEGSLAGCSPWGCKELDMT